MERAAGAIIAGRYRLVEKLGSGGMGAVWLCHDLSLDSTCAVKIIDPEKSRSEEARKRFVREAKAAAQLRGPHVVDVFDRGEYEGVLYIAMEYLEGEDLCTRLVRERRLDFATTYRIIAHVARALSSAHALGIVHRDLKPENIFLVPGYDEEVAKVLDFGIAQHEAYRLEDQATREGSFLGTPYYVSPEQARGKSTDHRSDLWSLAVIAYQCLTGKPPFDSESLGELMGLILYEPIPRITEANPDLPSEVETFWTRATQRERELRFQSARDFADALGQALGVRAVVTVPTLPPRRAMSSYEDSERESVSFKPLNTPKQLGDAVAVEAALQSPTADGSMSIDPFTATDQAVTRTPPASSSILPEATGVVGRLKRVPKRFLVLGAVGVGGLVGGLAMYAVAARQKAEVPALASAAPLPSQQAALVQLPAVSPASSLLPPPPEIILVPAPAASEREGTRPPPKRSGAGSSNVRRPPAGTPDYGI